MDEEDYRLWSAQVRQLTDQQLEDHENRIGLERSIRKTGHNYADDWLLPGLKRAMKKYHMLDKSTEYKIHTLKGWKTYTKDLPVVLKDLSKLLPRGGVPSIMRTNLANMTGMALIPYCESIGTRMIASDVLMQISSCRLALENSFPGYIDDGLFTAILRAQPGEAIVFHRDR